MTTGTTTTDDAARIRAWLLGRLSEAEGEELEAALLESDDQHDAIRAVESELFDELAAGRMSASDRAAFLERHRTPADRGRVAFARALAARAAAPNVVRTSRFGRSAFLAAAAVLALAVTALMLRAPHDERSVATGTVAEVAPPTDTAAAPAPRIEPLPAPVAHAIEVTIVLGTVRSDGGIANVELPPDASSLALRVELDPADAYDAYRLQVRDPGGAVVFDRANLRATADGEARAIAAEIPA
ncbi:MAG TPA: hypothetical protein VGF40_05175, partial [Thermoanaerobaculia bacterium]